MTQSYGTDKMSSAMCMVCGEAGHRSSRCKSLRIPPLDFETGCGGGGGHSHDDEDESISYLQLYALVDSEDDGILSKLREPVLYYHMFPSRSSNEVV